MNTPLVELQKYREDLFQALAVQKAEQSRLLRQKELSTVELKGLKAEFELKEKTARFLLRLGTRARAEAKGNIEDMVSNALQFIMEDDISFKIEYEEKAGRPEAAFYIVSRYEKETVMADPRDARGGGVVDIVAATLRIALAELFGVKGPIILDEPTKHLSARFVPNFAIFIRQISEHFNRQIIMISHQVVLAEFGDRTYLFEEKNGVSVVTDYTASATSDETISFNEEDSEPNQ